MNELTEQPAGSLAERAYVALRQAILRCDLTPGQQVTEAQLAEEYGFGRAAVRAALTRLCHERLLKVIPRHGYSVTPVTFKHVHDLFDVRLIIEPAATRLAIPRIDNRMIAELEALNEACRHLPGGDDAPRLREANKAFHVAVVRASGNGRLEEMARSALDELDRVLYLPQLANVWERIDSSYEEHTLIVDALRAKDVAAAKQAAHAHVLLNKRYLIDSLTSSPGLGSINLLTI